MEQYRARLGVTRNASDRDIKRAFLTAYGHPWQPGDNKQREQLRTAYELLQCAESRACAAAWSGLDEAERVLHVRQACCFDAFAVLGLPRHATLSEVQAACQALPRPRTDWQHLALQLVACFHVERYRAWLAQGYVSTRHEAVPVRLMLTVDNASHSLGLLTDLSLRKPYVSSSAS